MANDTKEKILEAALILFSENGYSATNIQSIADYVGIVKSALYRHYDSKEEIWNTVAERMISYYSENFGSVEQVTSIPENTEALVEMTMKMVNFTVHDERVIRMRRILLTEQFRDEKVRMFATRYFIEDTEAIFEKVFSGMIDMGTIKKADPKFLAFSYTAPITALVHLCDREPEKRQETVGKIERYVRDFIGVSGVNPVS